MPFTMIAIVYIHNHHHYHVNNVLILCVYHILNAFLKCGVSEKIIYSGTCTQLGAPRGPFPALISFQIPKS